MFRPAPVVVSACVALGIAASCSSERTAEQSRRLVPENEGVYSFASGCFAVEGFSGSGAAPFLRAAAGGDRFEFAAPDEQTASKFHLRAADLGTYLFYDTEKRFLTATDDGGSITFERQAKLQSSVELLDDSFKSPAEWVLETSARDPQRFQLKHYATERYLTLTGLTENESEAAIIALFPQEGCAEFPELTIDAEGRPEPRSWPDGDLFGIAEIHSHMHQNFAFGGGNIYHGAPFHRLGVEYALPSCEAWHGPEGRRDLVSLFLDTDLGDLDIDKLLPIAVAGESEDPVHNTDGYPKFTEWPNSWKRETHQTMYYRWLERAYLAGLRLMINHASGNNLLCELVAGLTEQGTRYSCNDMVSVRRSLLETRNLERYIDAQHGGPGKGWFRVVESPAEARQVISEGKLAVILGIEISNLFDCFSTPKEGFETCTPDIVRARIDEYRELGVRVVFPVHKYDNAFSPGDGSDGVIELGNIINSGHYSSFTESCEGPSTAFDGGNVTFGGLNRPRDQYDAPPPLDFTGFQDNVLGALLPLASDIQEGGLDGNYCQSHTLTPLGETLVNELMLRGMMIDVAHLPEKALARTYELLEAADYPALKTHGNANMGRVYQLGGLVGLRFDRCASTAEPKRLLRPYQNGVNEAVANGAYPSDAFSFDSNGFAGGPRPRFGPDSGCGEEQANPVSYPFTSYDGIVTFNQPQLGDRSVDYNTEGMIHIGLLPEYIEDTRRDGATDEDLEPLFRSAEAVIRMWERAEQRAQAMK